MKSAGRGWVAGCLLAGLLVSASANLWLVATLRQMYRERLETQIWPATEAGWPVVIGDPHRASHRLLLLGDSRLSQWSFAGPDNTLVINAGLAGATTAQIRQNLPALLEQYRPDMVVIEAGINDLKFLGLEPGRADAVIAHTLDNLTNMVGQCQAHGSRVLLLTIWPTAAPDWRRRLVWSPVIPASVARLNRLLADLPADLARLQVVDLFAVGDIRPGPDTYQDTLHLRSQTYQRLNPILTRVLARYSSPESPATPRE